VKTVHKDGREIEKDDKTGRITRVKLPSDLASEMGKRSAEVRWSNDAAIQRMLEDAGFGDDNPPLEFHKQWAAQAVKNSQANREWRQHFHGVRESDSPALPFRVLNDYVIEYNGQHYVRGLSSRDALSLLARIEEIKRESLKDAGNPPA
jgi:hypothetical protein